MTAATSIAAALAAGRRRLAAAGIEQPGLEARLLLADALGCGVAELIGYPERPLPAGADAALEQRLMRRLGHEPIAYILGRREFWSLALRVDARVLVPRPDTETLVEAALAAAGGRRRLKILDLGTGSGCLLLALLSELPDAWGVGVDVSEAALGCARANAELLHLDARAAFVCADWAAALDGQFDIIVSNPPYIADGEWAALEKGVRDFEPASALRAGPDGLAAYRRILPALRRLLAPEGRAFVEIGGAAGVSLSQMGPWGAMQVIGIKYDLGGHPRCLEMAASAPAGTKNFLGNQLVPV